MSFIKPKFGRFFFDTEEKSVCVEEGLNFLLSALAGIPRSPYSKLLELPLSLSLSCDRLLDFESV